MEYFGFEKDYLAHNIDEFVAINKESVDSRMRWDKDNFTYEADGKWQLSVAVEKDKELIGYIIGTRKTNENAHVNLLMVGKNHRQINVGKKLVIEFLKRCKVQKYTSCSLWVYDDLLPVKSFYKKLGFSKDKERINDKGEKLSMFVIKL